MNKKTGFLAMAVLAAGLAQAGVLYWQVAPSVTVTEPRATPPSSITSTLGGVGGSDYAYARLVTGTEANPQAVASYVIGASSDTAVGFVDMVGADGATMLANISSCESSASFWVELYSASGAWIGRSASQTGSQLSSYVHDPTSFTPADMSPTVMSFSGFTTVPEPTSGLLMLIGAGLLGLRRRKQA